MNTSEPVAWWCAKEYADSDMEGGHVEELEFNQPSVHDSEGLIWEKPLYTAEQLHPAKTLTDAIKTLKYLLEVAQEDYKTMNSHFVIEQVKQALKELGNE